MNVGYAEKTQNVWRKPMPHSHVQKKKTLKALNQVEKN